MDYTITEVLGVKDNVYEGKAGIRFKVEGVEHQLSSLTNEKSKFTVGAVIHGTITSKEKDGKTFYNFNEKGAAKASAPAGDINRVEMKLDAMRNELKTVGGILTDIKGVLGSLVKEKDGFDGGPF